MTVETPTSWDRSGLEAAGLDGFQPLVGLDLASVPVEHGVYAVLRADASRSHSILLQNPVTRGRVAYSIEELSQRWVADTTVVYIGKAAGRGGLQNRLRPFSRQSRSHSGGRSIWQLEEAHSLLVAWCSTPDEDAAAVETVWISAFKTAHSGRRPFANRRD